MAPHPPQKKAKAKVAAKPKALPQYKGQIDKWKHCPKTLCKSCSQNTSTIDKQSPADKPKFLHCVQKKAVKPDKKHKAPSSARRNGKARVGTVIKFHPDGDECCPCYVIRRKLWPKLKKKGGFGEA